RYQARREFRMRLRRDHCLRAFSHVAAPDAVELERRASPKLLNDRESFFPGITWRANGLLKIFFLPGQSIQRFAFGCAEFSHIVVKARDGDAKVLVVKFRE